MLHIDARHGRRASVIGPESRLGDLLRQSDWGELDADSVLLDLARVLAEAVGCNRAGVRLLRASDGGAPSVLETVAWFDRKRAVAAPPANISDDALEPYLNTMARVGGMAVADVDTDARLPGGLRRLLAQRDVRSVLEVAISVNGPIYGTLVCEQVDCAISWSPRQVDIVRRLASRIAPTIMRVSRRRR